MPKKRKAGKRKKGSEPNSSIVHNSPSSPTHSSTENDDLRNQEERDSDDVGENEVVSPATDQGNPNPFTEESDELEKRDGSQPVRSVVSESKSFEGDGVDSEETLIVGLVKSGVIEIIEQVKSEDSPQSNSMDAGVECIEESVEILTNGGDCKRPDDSTPGNEHEIETDEKRLEVEPESVVLEVPDDSFPRESTAEMNDDASATTVEDSVLIDKVEWVAAVSEKVIHVTEFVLAKKEDSDLKSKLLLPETMLDVSSKVEESSMDEIAVKTLSDVARDVPAPIAQDEKPLPVSEGSIARAIDLVQNTKEKLEFPETSHSQQPLVAPVPQLAEKTSWFGCCGIFDLIRGGK